MIYSTEDVKRILDTLYNRIYRHVEYESFATDELDTIREEIEKLKREISAAKSDGTCPTCRGRNGKHASLCGELG